MLVSFVAVIILLYHYRIEKQKEMMLDYSQAPQFNTLIEEAIVVGLNENCKCIQSSTEFKWITSLQIATQSDYENWLLEAHQNHHHTKFVEIGNGLYLKIWFCEKDKKPITKIKSSKRISNPDLQPLHYPYHTLDQDYLCFVVKPDSKIVIQDVEMVQVKLDNELQMPLQSNYEIIRLPSPCQQVQKQEHSNSQEHMLTKIRYLLVKTLDVEEHEHHLIQRFQPEVIFQHSMKNKTTLIEYKSFHEFCFPEGVALHKRIIGYGYSIFNFLLTQEDGTRIYVNCLKFKQKLPQSILQSLPSNCIDKHIHNQPVFYTQKALCLLSKYCCTQFFHTLLEQLFRKYQTDQNKLKFKGHSQHEAAYFQPIIQEFIEKYEIGFRQSEKKYNQCEFLKEDIHIEMEWDHSKIIFPLPKEKRISFYSPKAVHCLFKMLSIEKIVDIVEALLLQQTLIFVSNSQVAVGYAIESLISFLYPLKWQHVILPILPQDLLILLQAPMPLIAGIPTSLASDDLIMNLKEQAVIIFLDCNQVLYKDKRKQSYQVNHFRQVIKKLRMYDIYVKNHVNQMLEFRDHFYLFQIHEKEEVHFSAEHIKHIFFEMILLLLQNYYRFYHKNCNGSLKGSGQQLEEKKSQRERPFNFKKDYNLEGFIQSHPKRNVKFMRKFTESAHFISFIYHYHQKSDNPSKIFIDSALQKQNNHKDSYIFQGRYSEHSYTFNQTEIKKKLSCPSSHNLTWSPSPKKIEELSVTASTRTADRNSIKIEQIQVERERSVNEQQKMRANSTAGGNICEALARAMNQMSKTKKNLIMWTAARLGRLKKQLFTQKQIQNDVEQQNKQENQQVKQVRMAREDRLEEKVEKL